MNSFSRAATIVLLFLTTLGVRAQEAPLSHEVSFPMGDAAWQVAFPAAIKSSKNLETPEASPAVETEKTEGPERFKKIAIVRMGSFRRDTVIWTNGIQGEFWWSEKSGIVVWKKGDEDLRAMRSGFLEPQRFDLSAFTWVNKSTYRGLKPVGKTEGQYYRMEVVDAFGYTKVYQAWLDPQTRRPLALQVGEAEIGIFTFDLPLPESPISISGDFAATLDRCERALTPRKSHGR